MSVACPKKYATNKWILIGFSNLKAAAEPQTVCLSTPPLAFEWHKQPPQAMRPNFTANFPFTLNIPHTSLLYVFGKHKLTLFARLPGVYFHAWFTFVAVLHAMPMPSDDRLNLDEFTLICRALFRNDKGHIYDVPHERLEEIFAVFDVNGDGFIDREEFKFCWNQWIKTVSESCLASSLLLSLFLSVCLCESVCLSGLSFCHHPLLWGGVVRECVYVCVCVARHSVIHIRGLIKS